MNNRNAQDAAISPAINRLPRFILIFLSLLYRFAVNFRLFLYRVKILRGESVEGVKVISIGNLTVGGTGKTPVTIMIARLMKEKTAVVSRGYKRASTEAVQVVSDGSGVITTYPDAADEALLCASELAGIPVICSPRRIDGIRAAFEKFQSKTVLLDDAFSHLAVARDKNLLLVDALDPFGNGRLLPAGPLREPLSSIERADALLITRANLVKKHDLADTIDEIKEHAKSDIQIFHCHITPGNLITPEGTQHRADEFLKGKTVRLLSGIAGPEQFEETVKRLGAQVKKHYAYEDHHRFTEEELEKAIGSCGDSELLITTAKDFARIPSAVRRKIFVLTIKAEIEKNHHDNFLNWILS